MLVDWIQKKITVKITNILLKFTLIGKENGVACVDVRSEVRYDHNTSGRKSDYF